MTPAQTRALYLDHCTVGGMEQYGEKAAVAAIMAVTAYLEAEARRYADFYKPHSDGRNTFVMFADMIANLTADRLATKQEQAA